MSVWDAKALESVIGNARRGLPEDVLLFVSRITPLVNVDLLIQDSEGRTLLTWRDDKFFGAGWHIPGGIIRYKETAADRVRECAREELTADVEFDGTPILVSEVIREQEERGHLISLLYRCRLLTTLNEKQRAQSETPLPGQWRWHGRAPVDLLEVQRHYARFF